MSEPQNVTKVGYKRAMKTWDGYASTASPLLSMAVWELRRYGWTKEWEEGEGGCKGRAISTHLTAAGSARTAQLWFVALHNYYGFVGRKMSHPTAPHLHTPRWSHLSLWSI